MKEEEPAYHGHKGFAGNSHPCPHPTGAQFIAFPFQYFFYNFLIETGSHGAQADYVAGIKDAPPYHAVV